jgi:tungstate transport system substrate-binding protein
MGEVLRIASERGAYTLTDRATYLFLREKLELEILVEGDEGLLNIYGVIPVSGGRKIAGAEIFMEWITGPEAQNLIGGYGLDRFGSPLFVPSAR